MLKGYPLIQVQKMGRAYIGKTWQLHVIQSIQNGFGIILAPRLTPSMNEIAFCSRIQINSQESSGVVCIRFDFGNWVRTLCPMDCLAFSTLPGFCACPGAVQLTCASTPGHGGRYRVIWLLALHGPRPCLAHAAGAMAHGVRLAGKAVSKSGVLYGGLPDRRPSFGAALQGLA